MKVVQCDLTPPLSVESVLVDEDPFRDPYLRTIFRMDKKSLMKSPILDDETFLSQLNKGIIVNKGELFSRSY